MNPMEGEHHDIVIVGGGICGLATALALRRMQDEFPDKSTTRVTPCRHFLWDLSGRYFISRHMLVGLHHQILTLRDLRETIRTLNPYFNKRSDEFSHKNLSKFSSQNRIRHFLWDLSGRYFISRHMLVGLHHQILTLRDLRETIRTLNPYINKPSDEFSHKNLSKFSSQDRISGESRCLKRSDLVETLADNLPMNSIRLGCKILAIETDPISYFPIIHLDDGSVVKAKVLIGCDGSNSVVAKSLGMAGPKLFPRWVIRGFTNYPNGQTFGNHFFRLREGHIIFGRTPVNEKLVHWFVSWPLCPEDSAVKKDSELMRDTTLELLKEFPTDIIEMVKLCDLESLSLTGIRYRAPWDLLLGNLWRGTTTVAGDAMHVMGLFIGQSGSAGLEDAVVLARCLAPEMNVAQTDNKELQIQVETALRGYVKERRLRILRLSTESYLTGLMILSSSWIKKVLILAILIVLFGSNSLGHTRYDCGRL